MKIIIQNADETFSILNTVSLCAFGRFDSREEAADALDQSTLADQLSRCGQ